MPHRPSPPFSLLDHESHIRQRFRCPRCALALDLLEIPEPSPQPSAHLVATCTCCNIVITRPMWHTLRDR